MNHDELAKEGDEKDDICQQCHVACRLLFAPCPFMEEIHNDHTNVWLCAECRHQNAMDI